MCFKNKAPQHYTSGLNLIIIKLGFYKLASAILLSILTGLTYLPVPSLQSRSRHETSSCFLKGLQQVLRHDQSRTAFQWQL
jgi:hypothetical protein